MGTILILSNSKDGEHTDSVIGEIRKLGTSYFLLNVDEISCGKMSIHFYEDAGSFRFWLDSGSQTVSSDQIKSVWFRRPNHFSLEISNQAQRFFAERELSSCLEGLYFCLGGAFWVNDPKSLYVARKKIYQLMVAKRLGLDVPRTVVTNVSGEAHRFFEACEQEMVYKTIGGCYVEKNEEAFSIYTSTVSKDNLRSLASMSKIPSLFQERLHGRELRITVIGEFVNAVEIEFSSQEVDWRRPEVLRTTSVKEVTISNELLETIKKMMSRLHIVFGAFDFILTPEGRYYFLEVNPNGQWYWIEKATGVNLSRQIASVLDMV
jgi:glutathione synthase/RimK-type ligase-like ATP-grasp enzyme